MEPSSPAEDDVPGWPLHQRLAGVVARTLAVGLALLPAVALTARAREVATILALALVFTLPVLAAERRDGRVVGALARLLVGTLIGVALVPAALASLQHVGDPMGAYDELGRLIDPGALLAMLCSAPLLSVPLGVLFAVRTCTSRLAPQLAAGLMVPALLTTAAVASIRPRTLSLLLVTGALLPLALWGAERLLAGRDPRAPRPLERDPRPCLVAFGVTLLLLGLAPSLAMPSLGYSWAPPSQGRSLVERYVPGAAPPDASWIGRELREGHVIRVLVDPTGRRWCIVADPVDPAVMARHGSWVGDHTGLVRGYAVPVAIDPTTCAASSGWRAP